MTLPCWFNKLDAIIDVRSRGLEHWSYNLGVIRNFANQRVKTDATVVLAPEAAQFCGNLGLIVTPRTEPRWTRSRMLNLILRELYGAILIIRYGLRSKNILVLHAHPFGVMLACLLLKILRCHLVVCLHNDVIKVFRENSFEDIIERFVWRFLFKKISGVKFVAPNKYFKRYLRLTRATSEISIIEHPIVDRNEYERLAELAVINGPRFDVGFFGQAQRERGLERFLKLVDSKPSLKFVIAGRGAKNVAPRPNLVAYEQPTTEIFSKILLWTNSMFIDLSGDYYRVGESGTYWDSVGLSMEVIQGKIPLLYRYRLGSLTKG